MNQVNCFGIFSPLRDVTYSNQSISFIFYLFENLMASHHSCDFHILWGELVKGKKAKTSDISVSLTETYVFKAKSSKLNELAGGHGSSIVILLSLLSFTVTLPICPRIGFPGHLAPIVSLYPLILSAIVLYSFKFRLHFVRVLRSLVRLLHNVFSVLRLLCTQCSFVLPATDHKKTPNCVLKTVV